jgi:hypothetical protein
MNLVMILFFHSAQMWSAELPIDLDQCVERATNILGRAERVLDAYPVPGVDRDDFRILCLEIELGRPTI